ncbi:MAG: PIN domain-containing protein [Candidatus Woesearchaeota archaeon]
MKEIFAALPRVELDTTEKNILLDTCFFIHTFENQHEHQLKELMKIYSVAMTTFNAEEFLLKEHVVDERVREYVRKFLKKYPIILINVNVHPGDRESEKRFVNGVDDELLKDIPDASDAVLIAAAIKTKSNVLTKDKHHLFTVKLENYLNKHGLGVYKEYHDLLK